MKTEAKPSRIKSRSTKSTTLKSSRKASARLEASNLGVGARLKVVRERANLTQRELAKRAGVTNATISLIEQEAHAPSLASLHRILSAIPISIADFFALPTSQRNALFYDRADLTAITRGAADLRVLSSERREKSLQLFIERYQPGAGTGVEPISHDGETAAFVISGTIEVRVGGVTRRLSTGGGYQVFGKQPYRLTNVGKTVAVVVCACTPPMF